MLAVADRDPRCKTVMLDPDTAKQDPMMLCGINRSFPFPSDGVGEQDSRGSGGRNALARDRRGKPASALRGANEGEAAMGAMIVCHSVHDYGAWRPVYDAHEASRAAAGLTGGRVFRSAEDPNDILLLFEMADRRRAEEFAASDDLRTAMQRAGVVGPPEIRYAE